MDTPNQWIPLFQKKKILYTVCICFMYVYLEKEDTSKLRRNSPDVPYWDVLLYLNMYFVFYFVLLHKFKILFVMSMVSNKTNYQVYENSIPTLGGPKIGLRKQNHAQNDYFSRIQHCQTWLRIMFTKKVVKCLLKLFKKWFRFRRNHYVWVWFIIYSF